MGSRIARPKVSLRIESRVSTPEQLEAGKKLFKRLLERAQSSLPNSNDSEQVDAKT